MKSVISPLKLGDHGADVANLQDALLLLIDKGLIQLSTAEAQSFKTLLSREQQGQAYQGTTSKAVVTFQQQQHLQQTGAVDAPTAAALNQILKDLGALDAAENGSTEVVKALNVQGQTLSAINLGTNHLVSIDQKIGTLGKTASLSLNMRGDAVK